MSTYLGIVKKLYNLPEPTLPALIKPSASPQCSRGVKINRCIDASRYELERFCIDAVMDHNRLEPMTSFARALVTQVLKMHSLFSNLSLAFSRKWHVRALETIAAGLMRHVRIACASNPLIFLSVPYRYSTRTASCKDAYGKMPFFSWTEVLFNHAVKLHDYWFLWTYGDDTRQYSRRNGRGIWLYKRSFRHRILRFFLLQRRRLRLRWSREAYSPLTRLAVGPSDLDLLGWSAFNAPQHRSSSGPVRCRYPAIT